MTIKTLENGYASQTGIVAGTSNEFILDGTNSTSILVTNTAAASIGAVIEFSISSLKDLAKGNGIWYTSKKGNLTESFDEASSTVITGVRLVASDGTWTLEVRQKRG